jgi:hypothetical protein
VHLYTDLRGMGKEIDVNKIMKGREDKDGQYTQFVKVLVPSVAGRKLWNNKVQRTTLLSDIVTVCDEALSLLLLINSRDRWEEMFQADKEAKAEAENESRTIHLTIVGESNEVTTNKKQKKLNATTKYTMDTKKQRNKDFGGWNNEGKRMFNRLKEDVEMDRINHHEWEKDFLKENIRLLEVRPKKRNRPEVSYQVDEVIASNSLALVFSDSESDDEMDDETQQQRNHCGNGFKDDDASVDTDDSD